MQNIKTFQNMFVQLWSILTKKQKTQGIIVTFMMMLSALLETLGVSTMIPFMLSLLEPELLLSNEYVRKTMDFLGMENDSQVIYLMAGAMGAAYILKNTVILIANFIQAKFRNRLEKDLSIVMLRAYIHKPYQFHLNVNSAEILRGVTGDMSGVASVVDAFSNLLNEVLTCVLIGGMLVILNPIMASGILLIAGCSALFIIIGMRKTISACGETCREAFATRYKTATQAVAGIKEINVMQKKEEFVSFFAEESTTACEYNTKYLCLAKMPSRIIETTFMISMLFLVCLLLKLEGESVNMIAQFGALAVASVRILPSISNITNSMNALVYHRPALEGAVANIKEASRENGEKQIRKNEDDTLSFQHTIEIQQITWKYVEEQGNVLENLSLQMNKGDSIALIGESGSGKTTLVDIILGLFKPQKGQILMDGQDIAKHPMAWAKTIGYVPQTVFLIDDTVRNNIAFGINEKEIDDALIWKAIEQAQLKSVIEKMPQGLDTILGERGVKISGGQRQRIAIARALYYNPEILVLDEATSALDTETETAVMEAVEALKGHKTMIIVAHRLTTIEKCDKIYEVKQGTVRLKRKEEVFHS